MLKITTVREAEKEIQELIDSFSDEIFIEACLAMESEAECARQAREEETESEE